MKLTAMTGIHSYDLGKPGSVSMEAAVRACAKAGYQYADTAFCSWLRPGLPMVQDDWEDWIRSLKEVGEEVGVTFPQAHAYYTRGDAFYADMTRTDGEYCEEYMRRSVIAAEILGVKWMVVHPYTVRLERWYDYRKSLAYNTEYFKRWGEFFAEHHVGMAIENMIKHTEKVSYCACGEELLELVDAIDNPMVQICVDTGHAHLSGVNPAQMIRMVGSHLKATHIADNHQNKDEHFAPFNGTIDWVEVIHALKEVDYQESFTYECHHLTSMYPACVQQNLINFSYDLGNYLLSL